MTKIDYSGYNDQLTPEQYRVGVERGTESAFSSPLYYETRPGLYRCAVCKQDLFCSRDKFESGTGWPSFSKVINSASIKITEDRSFAMIRREVSCSRCGCHLGHVFDDGPAPSGLRYCINGVMLLFEHEN